MIDLQKLCKITLENAEKRQKNGANITTDTRKMLKHCATEVLEAMEAYTELAIVREANKDTEVCTFEDEKHFESELADIVCCCLIIAGKEDIDIERAIYDCVEKNERRANKIGDKL